MYTEKEREDLLAAVTACLESDDNFEGLVQMGTGAEGFRDIYSDIDLMAGCRDVNAAKIKLYAFFADLDAVYIDRRQWSETVLGYSAYWENGLSVDISFMPTDQIPIRSDRIRVIFSKTVGFENQIRWGLNTLRIPSVDDSVHHPFIYALRRCEIAIARGEYIYADMALAEARGVLLRIESAREVKRINGPKEYNKLDDAFLAELEKTYPAQRNQIGLCRAKDALLLLYLNTVGKCDFLTFDDCQLKLLGCFE